MRRLLARVISGGSRPKRRAAILAGLVLATSAGVAARLVFLQLIDAEAFRVRAREQHEGQMRIEGRRGTIWDRNGRELAVSVETKSVYLHPNQISSPSTKERIVRGVASALGQPDAAIRDLVDSPRNRKFVFLRRRLSLRETKAISDLHLPGLGWMIESRRFYPRRALAAHALGFVDIDGKGQAGIERAFDDVVRGEPTTFISLVDARQRPLLVRTGTSGSPGRDLVLTLDEYVQHVAETEIDNAMDETGAKAGAIIVMDPRTGEILALANRPGFDPNNPAASPGKDRENFSTSYGYEPGSTFKLITASAAIEEGRARPTDSFDCGMGSISLYGRRVADHHPYGTLSLAEIISKSSNVGIIKVGQRLPTRTFCDYVERFGFGRPTGIDLPSEASGVVQTPGGRNWSGLSQAMMSMGQSIMVTPLQMLVAVAAIGAGGERPTPRIVRSITAADGTPLDVPAPPPVRVLSAATARAVALMMESVIEEGTGKSARVPGYRIAGKTGTAQKVVNGVYSHSAHVASFVGFVPSMNPALAAIVVLDEPVGKYYGGDIAAPAFARVMGPALAYLRVPPTEPIPPPETLHAHDLRGSDGPSAGEADHGRSAEILRARIEEPQEGDAPVRPFPALWPPKIQDAPGKVPDLFGLDLRDALTALARSGCLPRVSGSGFVIEQTPPPGTTITTTGAGEECLLVLAPESPAKREPRQGS